LKTEVLPIKQHLRKDKARAITEADKKFDAYAALRRARSHSKMWGKREKIAKEKAEAENNK
jgi:large subunit ribosomal protein L13e